jgi:hypothetical protein
MQQPLSLYHNVLQSLYLLRAHVKGDNTSVTAQSNENHTPRTNPLPVKAQRADHLSKKEAIHNTKLKRMTNKIARRACLPNISKNFLSISDIPFRKRYNTMVSPSSAGVNREQLTSPGLPPSPAPSR